MGRVNGLSWSKNPFSESLILEIQNAAETTRMGSDLQLSPKQSSNETASRLRKTVPTPEQAVS